MEEDQTTEVEMLELQTNHDETEKNYWAVILLVLCVFVVFENMTNFFIVSLAVADLLVAGFVMPFSVYVLVRNVSSIKCKNFQIKLQLTS